MNILRFCVDELRRLERVSSVVVGFPTLDWILHEHDLSDLRKSEAAFVLAVYAVEYGIEALSVALMAHPAQVGANGDEHLRGVAECWQYHYLMSLESVDADMHLEMMRLAELYACAGEALLTDGYYERICARDDMSDMLRVSAPQGWQRKNTGSVSVPQAPHGGSVPLPAPLALPPMGRPATVGEQLELVKKNAGTEVVDAHDEKLIAPYRDLGQRAEGDLPVYEDPRAGQGLAYQQPAVEPGDVAADGSIYRPTTPADIQEQIDKRRAENDKAEKNCRKMDRDDIVSTAVILGMVGCVFAAPFANTWVYPASAGVIGVFIGGYIGSKRLDYFWSMGLHGGSQIFINLVAVAVGWQGVLGYGFMIIAGLWLFHICIGAVVGIRFICRR